jgi:hypothetical protein
MYVNTINNVTKRHMPAEREEQKVAAFDSAVMLECVSLLYLTHLSRFTVVIIDGRT